MGVVHKLRDEVVDFILAHKKKNPDISCRKLSEVVSEKFGTFVSKSSISTVLKSAHLNSPVGRHPGDGDDIPRQAKGSAPKKAVKKFKIPDLKKKQIFVPDKLPPARKPNKVTTKQFPPAPPKPQKIVLPVKPVATPPFVATVSQTPASAEMSNLKSRPQTSRRTPVESPVRAGEFFLKAAEWELFAGSVLGRVLREELGGRFEIDYDLAADALVFPDLFLGTDGPEQFIRRHRLFFGGQGFDISLWDDAMRAIRGIDGLGLKLAIEIELLWRQSCEIRLGSASGPTVYMDPLDGTVAFDNVQSGKTGFVTMAAAGRRVWQRIIHNVQSEVFHYEGHPQQGQEVFSRLRELFGSSGERGLSKAALWGMDPNDHVAWGGISPRKRSFGLVVHAPQVFFSGLSKAPTKPQEIEVLGERVSYWSVNLASFGFSADVPGQGLVLRLMGLSSEEKLFLVLSGSLDGPEAAAGSARDCAISLRGRGQRPAPLAADHFKAILAQIEGAEGLDKAIQGLRSLFLAWMEACYWGGAEPSRELLASEGTLAAADSGPAAYITLACNQEQSIDLSRIASRFHASAIFDPHGRRVILK